MEDMGAIEEDLGVCLGEGLGVCVGSVVDCGSLDLIAVCMFGCCRRREGKDRTTVENDFTRTYLKLQGTASPFWL